MLTRIQARKCCRMRLGADCHGRRWYRASKKYTAPYRDVRTLNPANFLKLNQEWIDISSLCNPTVRVCGSTPDNKGRYGVKPVQLVYTVKPPIRHSPYSGTLREMWPPNARGFLYYSNPVNRPRIAAELRFRLTPTNDVSTFEQGKDLCFSDPNSPSTFGEPWKRPLYSIATNTNSRPLYENLLRDGLVSAELHKSIQSLPKFTFMYSRCHLLHTLYDPFTFDVSSDWITLVAVTESRVLSIQLLRLFKDRRTGKSPYTGILLARFEPSSLPQHADSRTVVLRILREITPVRCIIPSYDGYIEHPKPNGLFSKHFHHKFRPWSVDLDKPETRKRMVEGLDLMWESTPGLAQGLL